jgi:L,D-peptidoglycan transpeptidase YkuD (ErfK/YbiS/YcfS/YnhG family)
MDRQFLRALSPIQVAFAGIAIAFCAHSPGIVAQRPAQPEKADSVLILKKDHLLELLSAGKVIRTYKVALGQGGLEPKRREGDGRTPVEIRP